MAEKRMFTKKVTNSDAFLDMPLSAQALYFHLNMEADDDGFNGSPKKTQRMIRASDDDLKLLLAKGFAIPFESGVVVIKHWRLHNYIQKDRYKETVYTEEKKMLEVQENKTYSLMYPNCIQNVSEMDPQIRLDKNSIDIISSAEAVPNSDNDDKEIKKESNAEIIRQVIDYMNNCGVLEDFKIKKTFKYNAKSNSNIKIITARINEGNTLEDFKDVIYHTYDKFIENEFVGRNGKSSIQYYRPSTLFASEKMEQYKNEYKNM